MQKLTSGIATLALALFLSPTGGALAGDGAVGGGTDSAGAAGAFGVSD